jgi:hypothetical protein
MRITRFSSDRNERDLARRLSLALAHCIRISVLKKTRVEEESRARAHQIGPDGSDRKNGRRRVDCHGQGMKGETKAGERPAFSYAIAETRTHRRHSHASALRKPVRREPPQLDGLFAVSVVIPMTARSSTKHPIVAGFHAVTGGGPIRREAQFEQLADSGSPGRHAMLKSEVVNHRQLFRRKHDLQSLTTEIVHGPSNKSNLSVQREISKLLNSLSQSKFRRLPKNPKISKSFNNINNLGVYRLRSGEYATEHRRRNVWSL